MFAAAIRENGGAAAVRNQDALSNFREWIFNQHGFGASGYVGTIDDLAAKSATVMWYGPTTPLLKSIIAEGARRGIVVRVQHRKYSLQQLKTAAQLVFKQAAAGKWTGFKVSAVEALSAADAGLAVDGTYTSVSPAERAPQVRSLATVISGVPARIVAGRPVTPASGRDDDFSPFNAGGYMVDNTSAGGDIEGNTCSSGFSVLISGVSHVTTARHCIYEDGGSLNYADYVSRSWYTANTPTMYHYGNGNGTFSTDGGAAVMTASGSDLSFVNSWNTDVIDTVVQFSSLGLNDLVCTEGGNSGEHCNVKVTNLLVEWNDSDGTFATIEGQQQTSGKIAVIQGDSGGPVITIVGTAEVGAAGMIEAATGTEMTGSGCAPAYDLGSNICGTAVLFSSMQTIVSHISGASLYTG
jgi:hypothetical protein